MSFTDNIIFNSKARTLLPKADVDHRHVSDDDDLFQQPFRPMAEPINRTASLAAGHCKQSDDLVA